MAVKGILKKSKKDFAYDGVLAFRAVAGLLLQLTTNQSNG
jgi:hypothetical protein